VLASVFGPRALEHGLFYRHERALRFELSVGSGYIELFSSAYDRAREVLGFVFHESPDLGVILSYIREETPRERRAVLRSLRDCGLRVPRPRTWWTTVEEEGEDSMRWTYLAFRAPKTMLNKLLWGVLAAELGIRPRLRCGLYLADPARGVLAHPYDDRGMDVIGPNTPLLRQLYQRFNGYLLDYDRARMDADFGR
jgi:hypothetical protein